MKMKEISETVGENNSGNQLSISNISFNDPVSPMNQSGEPAGNTTQVQNSSKNDSREEMKKAPGQALRRRSTMAPTGLKGPKAGKTDLAATFMEAAGGLCDLTGKNLSDMHSNDLHKCIKQYPVK